MVPRPVVGIIFFFGVLMVIQTNNVYALSNNTIKEWKEPERSLLKQANALQKYKNYQGKNKEALIHTLDSISSSIINVRSEQAHKIYLRLAFVANQTGLREKSLDFYTALTFYHYKNKQRDSTLYYVRKTEKILDQLVENNLNDKLIRNLLKLAYVKKQYFGYTEEVTMQYEFAYQKALKMGYTKYLVYVKLQTSEILLDNNPDDIVLHTILRDLKEILRQYKDAYYPDRLYRVFAKALILNGEFELALKYIKNSSKFYNKNYFKALEKLSHSFYYYYQNQPEKALAVLDEICLYRDPHEKKGFDWAKVHYYSSLCYTDLKDFPNAIKSIKEAMVLSWSVVDELKYRAILIGLLKTSASHQEALEEQEKYSALFLQFTTDANKTKNSFFVTKINNANLEQSNGVLEGKINAVSLGNGTLIILIILILIFTFFVTQKNRKEKLDLLLIKDEQSKKFNKELIERENQIQLVALKVANRTQKIKELKPLLKPDTLDDNVKKKLKYTCKKLIDSGEHFTIESDELTVQYPGMIKGLKRLHPELTKTEIKYCILTQLDLSIKEIAETLHVTPNTVKHAKSMIKKKIGFDKVLSLQCYLNKIIEKNEVIPIIF